MRTSGAILLLIALAGPGCSDETKPATGPPRPTGIKKPVKEWFSLRGNWSGERVAKLGCTRCHGSRAQKLQWTSMTREQWTDFFHSKRHDQHAAMDTYFSPAELAGVLGYIKRQLP